MEREMLTKNADRDLYHGVFNWSGESHDLYTHATSPDRAFKQMTAKLAKKLQMSRYAVAIRFLDNHADNYHIEKETKR